MSSLRHRRFATEVQRLFDGALGEQRTLEVLGHLSHCEGCQEDLRWWSALRDALQSPATFSEHELSAPPSQ